MTDLVSAYQRREVHEAERILRENKRTIMDDPFIRAYIDDVLRGLRTQYLIDLIKPYTRIELGFLARQLNVTPADVEALLMTLILDGKVSGKIDQVHARLELDNAARRGGNLNERRYRALGRWQKEVASLSGTVQEKHGNGAGGGASVVQGSFGGLGRMAMGIGPGLG